MKDIQQIVTDQIIEQMEKCKNSNWKKPWFTIGTIPVNAVTKKAYRGINIFVLGMSNFKVMEFASYKQWVSIGATVKKDEHGTPIIFYKLTEYKDKDSGDKKTIPYIRYSTVFNADQVDGYEPDKIELSEHERMDGAEKFIDNCSIDTSFDWDRACYIPSQDEVQMPALGQFPDKMDYYSTLFHEYSHATGHKKRLDRKQKNSFGDKDYAYEELIAELGSAITMANLKLESRPREDHAKYLNSWIKKLKSDKKFIFTASSKAQAAFDWMFKKQPEPIEE